MINDAVIALLESESTITEMVGNRIYDTVVPQNNKVYPVVVIRNVSNIPHPTFDGASAYDFAHYDIAVMSEYQGDVEPTLRAIRSAIEDTTGTFASVAITGVRYMGGSDDGFNNMLEMKEASAEFRIFYTR